MPFPRAVAVAEEGVVAEGQVDERDDDYAFGDAVAEVGRRLHPLGEREDGRRDQIEVRSVAEKEGVAVDADAVDAADLLHGAVVLGAVDDRHDEGEDERGDAHGGGEAKPLRRAEPSEKGQQGDDEQIDDDVGDSGEVANRLGCTPRLAPPLWVVVGGLPIVVVLDGLDAVVLL